MSMSKEKTIMISFNIKKLKKVLGTSIVLSTLSLNACSSSLELADNVDEIYDAIGGEEGYDVADVDKVFKQINSVPGEDFKLIVEYSFNLEQKTDWTITAPKKLIMKSYTEGLDENTKVYIDNIHTDTSTVATYTTMNGILQDSMDDHIHNSLMLGFPISDEVSHYCVNQIEGQNDTFVSGSIYAVNGYTNGNISERRLEESDYLEYGVYGSLISSTYDLLIQKGDMEPYGIDVDATVIVYADNEVEVLEKSEKDGEEIEEIVTYRYNRGGGQPEKVSSEKVKKKK